MLVFIDESGDTGLKIEKGSSRYFVISLVMFDDYAEASAYDQRIKLLRRELKERLGKILSLYQIKRNMDTKLAKIKYSLLPLE